MLPLLCVIISTKIIITIVIEVDKSSESRFLNRDAPPRRYYTHITLKKLTLTLVFKSRFVRSILAGRQAADRWIVEYITAIDIALEERNVYLLDICVACVRYALTRRRMIMMMIQQYSNQYLELILACCCCCCLRLQLDLIDLLCVCGCG